MDKPYYPFRPISSIAILAKTLGIHEKMLLNLANKVDDSYTEFLINVKGKDRTVYEPKHDLKKLQKRINHRIFEKVQYPVYLQGGIKDPSNKRDYVENAKIHCERDPNIIISIDIKSFYDNIKSDYVFNVYKNFFIFPDEVSEILTKLTTFKNKVPQGACTSSYLANLIFFNTEYSLVSKFRSTGICYTRLLDDVTLSSNKFLSEEKISSSIKDVVAMFRKYKLKHNNKKTKVECQKNAKNSFKITGLWVGHSKPKTTRHDRRYIRLLVKICENKFKDDKYSLEYHTFWNKTSGLVAKLSRLEQSNHVSLRERMSMILPLYDDKEKDKIIRECKAILKFNNKVAFTIGQVETINKVIGKLGILARNNKSLSKIWRSRIRKHCQSLPSKRSMWL
ncbi:reverse transcriptase family protein [Citrobacter braakii]|uniref:Reverse transcriptase n=1 Tax=Citrobacter braakii TaxID=57706 RepID=A0A1V8NYW8_CITBR|nr:reverse transcriptase family protein [Citrobacter braakii]OQM41547.1 reverse transcriptase [Citrobacter braakii]QXC15907.1 reverse transcriptase family protein [Citrobacter braakii]